MTKIADFIRKKPYVVIVGIVILFTIYGYYVRITEWNKCHIKTDGKIVGVHLQSNKLLVLEVLFTIDNYLNIKNYPYKSKIACGDNTYLVNCYRNNNSCIGEKCIVYYACNNPDNIRYELIKKDTLR